MVHVNENRTAFFVPQRNLDSPELVEALKILLDRAKIVSRLSCKCVLVGDDPIRLATREKPQRQEQNPLAIR